MNFIKHFIIGSSFPIILPFFYIVGHKLSEEEDKNYELRKYILIAPLYLGLMNVIRNRYKLSLPQISVISTVIVSIFAKYTKSYNFTTFQEWFFYILSIFIQHTIAYYKMTQIANFI